jgi:transposase InsO family protein
VSRPQPTPTRGPVNIHNNARLTAAGRRLVARRVAAGEAVSTVAAAVGVSRQTIYKWVWRAAADPRCQDASSCPKRSPRRLPRHRRRQIEKARARRWSSPRIAQRYGLPLSTVVTHVRRLGLARLPRLAPPDPVRRYERAAPGQLVHLDVKKLGRIGRIGHRIHGNRRLRARGVGWEFLHVAIDDHSRVAYAELLPDEQGATAAGFLTRAAAWFAIRGVSIERVLTDNGSCYRSLRFATTALDLGIGQRFTRPYRPQTNGKAERFIRTLLAEWAYARPYGHSNGRRAALAPYLAFYNFHRRHSAIGFLPPASRLPAAL